MPFWIEQELYIDSTHPRTGGTVVRDLIYPASA
jgi:hypothetical protein